MKNGKPIRIDHHIAKSLAELADDPTARRVTTYVTKKLTVKVTRQARTRRNAPQQTFLLSVGTPNFLERRFLKSGKYKKLPTRKIEAFAG